MHHAVRTLSVAAALTATLAAQSGSAPCYEPDFGTLIGIDDDFVFPAITLNTPFPAFGNLYPQVEVSSNGFVWLGANNNTDSGCCSGTGSALAAGAARICALWTDLVTDGQNGSGVYHASLAGRDVITWANTYESFDPAIRFTIQLQLTATGEVTVWFHPATGIVQPPHSALCGMSPGGVADPGSTDFSFSFPLSTGTQATLYEEWATSTFDLAQRAIEFLPNGNGGWLLQDRAACPFVPGTWTTFGVGCPPQQGVFGASCYETFTGATLDLDNLEFELVPIGTTGYLVQATSGAFFSGFTNAVPLQDDNVIDQTLPFAFPLPGGGACTTAGFCSNGFVWLDNFNNSPPGSPFVPSFLFDGPRISPLWVDLDFTAGGSAYFDATATVAHFTWFDAPDWSNPSLRSTFQVQLFSDGRIKLCYQGLNIGATRPALAGFGAGGQTYDPGSTDLTATVPFATGSGLLPLTMDWVGVPPVLGQPFPLEAGNIRPSALFGVLVLGLQQFNPGLPLGSIGMPNCFAYASLDVTIGFTPTGFVTPINVLTFPSNVAFAGFAIHAQVAMLDPGVTPFGLAASNGGTMTVGMY